MRNDDRLLKLQTLIHEAERLAKAECRLQHEDRCLVRLTTGLWICRDIVDEAVENTVMREEPPEGRADRPHL